MSENHVEDANEAIDLYNRVISNPNSKSSTAYQCQANLASILSHIYKASGNAADLRAAALAYEQALSKLVPEQYPVDALDISRMLGRSYFILSDWESAAKALSLGLRALDILYRTQLTNRGQTTWLSKADNLHNMAAYALAKSGRLQEAVLVLEKGRARGLSQALELDELNLRCLVNQGHTELAEQYRVRAKQLEQLFQIQRCGDANRLPDNVLAPIMKNARKNFEAVVAAIRQLQGFESFLKSLTIEEICDVARDAPLVYITVTEFGGLALIVRDDENNTTTRIFLPQLTENALKKQAKRFTSKYAHWKHGETEICNDWFKVVDHTTKWLWEVCMGELNMELVHEHKAIIIPANLLGLLPLHAAWTVDRSTATGRRYALDQIDWTYAPNAKSLQKAQLLASQSDQNSLLAVEEPQPVSESPIPYSELEIQAVLRHFPQVKHLAGANATHTQVLESLPNSQIIHFSCHGSANRLHPLESGLLLANNETLRLRDLLELDLWKARLVILSACESGVIGTDLPDEVVSLPSGLLQIGAAGVLASLWNVNDASAALLMIRFYELWRLSPKECMPSQAICEAQRWLRDATKEELQQWIEKLPLTFVQKYVVQAGFSKFNPSDKPFEEPFHWAAFYAIGQ